jgi:hypothetical protein
MINGLQMNLKDAIEDVGGQVPEKTCLWEYPEIIRKNLTTKTVNIINLIGKDIIKINSEDDTLSISTEVDTKTLNRPNYATTNWNNSVMSADEIFNDLFNNVLPAVRGIYSADITVTDTNGIDKTNWENTLFNQSGIKTDLKPSSKYLRLYLTCQAEPLFVFIDAAITNLTNGYNVKSSDSVTFELDDINMTMTAHINCVTTEQIKNLN